MIKGEFLIATSTPQGGGLGMFVSSNGDPVRGTLEWPAIPRSMAFHFPYIIALLRNNIIEIHNLFTQQRIQKILLPSSFEPRFLIEASYDLQSSFGEKASVKVAVACKESVLGLRMTTLEGQVDQLLERKSIEKAVALAEQMMQGMVDEDGERKRTTLRSLYQRAGLVYFRDTLFDEALEMFKKAQLDPRLLIGLFPGLSGSEGVPSTPSGESPGRWVAEMGNIDNIVRLSLERNYPDADEETMNSFGTALAGNAKEMLERYLVFARENKAGVGRLEEIDTILLKIYVESNPNAMYELLERPNYCQYEECEKFLLEKKKYYATSILYRQNNLLKKTLDMWLRIASEEVEDPDFPGVALIVNFLAGAKDKELVWRYAGWVLGRNVGLGVQIFTEWKGPPLDPDDVLEFLKPFGIQGGKMYLEFLVGKGGQQDEKRHTALCLLYVDEVLRHASDEAFQEIDTQYKSLDPRPLFLTFLKTRSDPLSKSRAQLLHFLDTSQHYNVKPVANRIDEAASGKHLAAERAVVQGVLRNHEGVLRILVEEVGVFVG
ncbi:transforming growth factor, beta receptor associated protein 1 [Rhizophlyctis rosea]|uniref:Transforming growth factor, beta receptor associated protein 1 n=1 Tax=Rhizophlyctis rosea TaxID=64517 RepID=A0AAD5S5I3_9FUNG|nr:transforming growth factor, beta receptor associated protein 1 [Rhizophlyctis rosea]